MRDVDWGRHEARLRELWLEGKSCSQIAAALGEGISRNAVIGKVHRLKLEARAVRRVTQANALKTPGLAPVARAKSEQGAFEAKAVAKAGRWKKPPGRKSKLAPADKDLRKTRAASRAGHLALRPPPGDVMLAFADGYHGQRGRVALIDLAEHHCRFPIDMTGGAVMYCGDTKEHHSAYCPAHAVRCFAQPPGRPPGRFKLQAMNGVVR